MASFSFRERVILSQRAFARMAAVCRRATALRKERRRPRRLCAFDHRLASSFGGISVVPVRPFQSGAGRHRPSSVAGLLRRVDTPNAGATYQRLRTSRSVWTARVFTAAFPGTSSQALADISLMNGACDVWRNGWLQLCRTHGAQGRRTSIIDYTPAISPRIPTGFCHSAQGCPAQPGYLGFASAKSTTLNWVVSSVRGAATHLGVGKNC
jgi:hypothetical protein